MTPAEIIREASEAGLSLSLEADLLRVVGPADAVSRWRPVIAKHKAEILELVDPSPAGISPDLWRSLRADSGNAAAFCLWHENRQPGARCPVKSTRGPEHLAGCLLWQIKQRGEDPAQHMKGPPS